MDRRKERERAKEQDRQIVCVWEKSKQADRETDKEKKHADRQADDKQIQILLHKHTRDTADTHLFIRIHSFIYSHF